MDRVVKLPVDFRTELQSFTGMWRYLQVIYSNLKVAESAKRCSYWSTWIYRIHKYPAGNRNSKKVGSDVYKDSYPVAVLFCVVTMLCWGSWVIHRNLHTEMAFPALYWDYVLGVLLFSLLMAFTMGSIGESGRGFISDIMQADSKSMTWHFWEG